MAAQPALIPSEVYAAHEPTVSERLDALNISQSFLADFLKISKAELSRSLRDGNRPVQIEHGLSQLENLVEEFHPVPIGFNDAAVIRELVRTTVTMTEQNRERLRGAMSALGSQL